MTLLHFQQAGHKPYALVGGGPQAWLAILEIFKKEILLDEVTLNKMWECIKINC